VKRPAFPPFPKTLEFIMTRPNVQNATVQIAFDGPKARTQPKDSFAADVLNQLLDHRGGTFYKKFVDSGLTFGAGLSYYTESQAGQVDLYAETTPESAVKVREMLLDEPKEWLKKGYFTDEQLEDVRRNLLINHKREVNQPSEYIKSLAFWWAVTGMSYYDSYLDNLKKTGFDQVHAFVRKYLVGKPYVAGILMSPEDAKKAKLKDDSQPLVAKYLAKYAMKEIKK
jgi:zinc protease